MYKNSNYLTAECKWAVTINWLQLSVLATAFRIHTFSKLSIFSMQYVNVGFCISSPCTTTFTVFHRNNTTSKTMPVSGRISYTEEQTHSAHTRILTAPLSSTHASYLQDWADKHNCVKLSPIPSTRHGKQACVSLSEKSAIIHCNVEMSSTGAYDGMYHSTQFHNRYHHPWYPLWHGSSEKTAGCWGCPAKPALTRPSWMTDHAEPDAVTQNQSEKLIICAHLKLGIDNHRWLTDKSCSISLVSLLKASDCLYWNKSLMKLNAEETLTLFSPGGTKHLRFCPKISVTVTWQL